MRLSQAVAPSRTIAVEFDGGAALQVTYRPASYTPREVDEAQAEAASGKADAGRIVDTVLRTLVSWDLTDDDDQPIPLEREPLMDLPIPVYSTILKALQRDQTEDAEGKA